MHVLRLGQGATIFLDVEYVIYGPVICLDEIGQNFISLSRFEKSEVRVQKSQQENRVHNSFISEIENIETCGPEIRLAGRFLS
jgi:hypothetical protein